MARITVEDCLDHQNNRFSLVRLAARRAKQLLGGSTPVTDTKGNRPIVSALREIAAGKVTFRQEEASAAKEFSDPLLEELDLNALTKPSGNTITPAASAAAAPSAEAPATETPAAEEAAAAESKAAEEAPAAESKAAEEAPAAESEAAEEAPKEEEAATSEAAPTPAAESSSAEAKAP